MAVVQCVVDITSTSTGATTASTGAATIDLPHTEQDTGWPSNGDDIGDHNGIVNGLNGDDLGFDTPLTMGDGVDDTVLALSGPMLAGPGVGLANLGNTCYQNCVFQCLLNNRYFVSHLTDSSADNALKTKTITANDTNAAVMTSTADDSIANQFLLLFRSYVATTTGSIRPEGIRDAMSRRHVVLADGRQHDAQEFLALLLDALHEQLIHNHINDSDYHNNNNTTNNHHNNTNHVTVNVNKRLKVSDTTALDDELTSPVRPSMSNTSLINSTATKSCVVDVFQGQLCSRIVCDVCRHTSQTYEPFMYLALPLPVVRHRQLVVMFTPLTGPATRLLVTIENKYGSVSQIKHKTREQLRPLLDAITDSELIVAEVMNGTHVTRIVDDLEDMLSVTIDGQSEVTIFQLNEPLNCVVDEIDTIAQCVICLEDKPIRSLLSHSRPSDYCIGVVCDQCLESAVKHYANDSAITSFTCFSCGSYVSKNQFIECQPLANRSGTFCVPLVFRSDSQLVYGIRMLRVSQQMDPNALYALVDARVPNPEFTYRLVFTERNGMGCCRCSWGGDCDGCEITRDGHVLLCEADTLCVAFDSSVLITASSSPTMNTSVATQTFIGPSIDPLLIESTVDVVEHESLIGHKPEESVPLNLVTCLEAFIANECLNDGDGDNLWFCDKCQVQSAATKSLHIMSSPKTLIVYLKRFLFMANNCHKLTESVHFPIDEPLDMTSTVANAKRPLLYRLSALVCHSGTAQTGHYTAYVRQEPSGQWLYFNDDIVTCETPTDSDSRAYILFYSRLDDQLSSAADS